VPLVKNVRVDLMQLLDEIRRAQGGRAIENMARSFNITPAQAEAAIAAVAPEFSRAVERNTLSRGGLADLIAALGSGRHKAALENPNLFQSTELRDDGNAILGHVLGSKDQSRAVAARASAASGLSGSLIQMLLPYIIQMLMGGLAGKTQGGLGDILSKIPGMPGGPPAGQGGGGLGDILSKIPGMPGGPPAGQGGGGLGDILSKIPGMPGGPTAGQGGGRQRMPDEDNPRWPSMPRQAEQQQDQSPWPPMQQSPQQPGGGGFGGSPLPLPGEVPAGGYGRTQGGYPPSGEGDSGSGPFGNLPDIIRNGKGIPGGAGGAVIGGGLLWQLIRSVLGGALGFSGKGGVMSWLFRMVFMRFGWGLIKTILSRVLLRR
jgi:hypothetical protein